MRKLCVFRIPICPAWLLQLLFATFCVFSTVQDCWSFSLSESNWADLKSRNTSCKELANFAANRASARSNAILLRNAVHLIPDLFSNVQSFSFALGASRGKVAISNSLTFDSTKEEIYGHRAEAQRKLVIRDMTLLEFQSRLLGGWDTLHFAEEFYLFSGHLPYWFQQGDFQKLRPLSCLKDALCPGCGRKKGPEAAITSAKFQVTMKGSVQSLRYDTLPKVLLVTKGEALLQLVSPKDVAGLQSYDREHPLYRRSSKPFEEVTKTLDYTEVVIRPGDAIVLDAYTAHQIQSIKDSIYFTYNIRR